MATINDLLEELAEIKRMVAALPSRTVSGKQVKVVNGLSEVDDNLGLVSAGEFRAGNRETPGQGFSGVRIVYPAVTYNSEDWHVVGINNDTLQFGLRASDGAGSFGAGTILADADGITIDEGSTQVNWIKWLASDGEWTGNIYSYYVSAGSPQTHVDAGRPSNSGHGSSRVLLNATGEGTTGGGNQTRFYVDTQTDIAGDQQGRFRVESQLDGVAHIGLIEGSLHNNAQSRVTINPDGEDIDLRVEGDTETNLLFVDAGLDRVAIGHAAPDTILDISGAFTFRELSADPSDPDEGSAVMWMSDGTGSGDDGDVMMKITAGGATKTATLVDFSAV